MINTKLITVRMSQSNCAQLEMERSNGIKSSTIINAGTAMVIELMDAYRSYRCDGDPMEIESAQRRILERVKSILYHQYRMPL